MLAEDWRYNSEITPFLFGWTTRSNFLMRTGIVSGTGHTADWASLNEPEITNSLPGIRLISIMIIIFAFITFGLGGAAYVGYSQIAAGSWWAGLASALVAISAIFTFNKLYITVNFALGILAIGCCIGGAIIDGIYSSWFGSFKACTMNSSADPYQYSTWDSGEADEIARAASQARASLDPTVYDTCYCAGKSGKTIGKVRVLYNSCYMITTYSSKVLAASCAMTAVCGALTFALCCYEVYALTIVAKRRLFIAADSGLHTPINEDRIEDPISY